MSKSKKASIIGSGFIAKSILPFFPDYHVQMLTRSNVDLVADSDLVIFAASSANPVHESFDKYHLDLAYLQMVLSKLEKCPDFFYMSSSCVYGRVYPSYESGELRADTVYGASKIAGEAIVNYYHNLNLIRGYNLRLSCVVGPGMTHGPLSTVHTGHVYLGSTESQKQYIDISDVAHAVHVLSGKRYGGTYNVCSDDNMSNLEVGNMLKEFGIEPSFKPVDSFVTYMINNKLSGLGWKMKFPSSRQVVSNYLKNAAEIQV